MAYLRFFKLKNEETGGKRLIEVIKIPLLLSWVELIWNISTHQFTNMYINKMLKSLRVDDHECLSQSVFVPSIFKAN